MRRFFAQWVERSGHPELDVSYRWDGERKTALITVAQQQTVDDDNPAFAFDVEVGFVADAPASARHRLRGRTAARRDARASARRPRAAGVRDPARARARARARRSGAWVLARVDVVARHRRARGDPAPRPVADRADPRRESARKRRSAASRARRSPQRSRTIRSSAWASSSRRRSAIRARRRRVPRCSPTRRTRIPKCAAPSRRRSARGATRRWPERCSGCATIRRTS